MKEKVHNCLHGKKVYAQFKYFSESLKEGWPLDFLVGLEEALKI
jgi:hypothetical protein